MAERTPETEQVGRLAMRVEGHWWVAYYAMNHTMDEAIELGRIRMIIVQDWQAKELFISIMRDAVSAILKDASDIEAEWTDPAPAPQHERAGRA